MYQEFFSLREKPFNVTADPNFLFLSRKHKEALSHLVYGIKERKGFLEITGEVGTGKTTLCRALLNQLNSEATKTAFIWNPSLSRLQLLKTIVDDLGIELNSKTRINMISELNKFLIEQLRASNNVVLIIDEAQNLKNSLMEEVRMLSNLETEKEKLLQIVLVGQPELRKKLNNPSLRQLRQRIGIRYHILPLDKNEVSHYIKHRLNIAGSNGSVLFNDDTIEEIFNYSEGIPRLINILCDKALLLAYVLEKTEITVDIIKKSIQEIEGNII